MQLSAICFLRVIACGWVFVKKRPILALRWLKRAHFSIVEKKRHILKLRWRKIIDPLGTKFYPFIINIQCTYSIQYEPYALIFIEDAWVLRWMMMDESLPKFWLCMMISCECPLKNNSRSNYEWNLQNFNTNKSYYITTWFPSLKLHW